MVDYDEKGCPMAKNGTGPMGIMFYVGYKGGRIEATVLANDTIKKLREKLAREATEKGDELPGGGKITWEHIQLMRPAAGLMRDDELIYEAELHKDAKGEFCAINDSLRMMVRSGGAPQAALFLKITTLTGKSVTLGVNGTDTADAIKGQYQDKTGTPAAQQGLWFPVKAGTAGAKSAAEAVNGWEKSKDRMPEEVVSGLSAGPLYLWDKEPMAAMAVKQGLSLGIDKEIRAFLVLSLRDAPVSRPVASSSSAPGGGGCCLLQ